MRTPSVEMLKLIPYLLSTSKPSKFYLISMAEEAILSSHLPVKNQGQAIPAINNLSFMPGKLLVVFSFNFKFQHPVLLVCFLRSKIISCFGTYMSCTHERHAQIIMSII